jgi:WXG100 family type VII secretion target
VAASAIEVNIDEFQRVSKLFKDAKERCASIEASIRNSSEKLLNTWTGDSRNAFESEYREIQKSLSNYKDILDSIGSELTMIGNSFKDADDNIKRNIDGLQY